MKFLTSAVCVLLFAATASAKSVDSRESNLCRSQIERAIAVEPGSYLVSSVQTSNPNVFESSAFVGDGEFTHIEYSLVTVDLASCQVLKVQSKY